MPNISAFLFLANRDYSTLTRQLEAVIIVVSMVQVLRLRTNSRKVHEAKYLPPRKVTYRQTDFHNGQASYFNMKVWYLYLENLDICNLFFKTTANLCYDQSIVLSVTKLMTYSS